MILIHPITFNHLGLKWLPIVKTAKNFVWRISVTAAILGLASILVVSYERRMREPFRIANAESDCCLLARGLRAYYLDYQRLPRQSERFEVDETIINELTGIGKSESTRKVFIDAPNRWLGSVIDPWGRRYECHLVFANQKIQPESARSLLKIVVYSIGKVSCEALIVQD